MAVFSGLSLNQILISLLKIISFLLGALGMSLTCLAAGPLSTVAVYFENLEILQLEVLWAQFTIGVIVTAFSYLPVLISNHISEHYYEVSVKRTLLIWNILATAFTAFIVVEIVAFNNVITLAHLELRNVLNMGLRQFLVDVDWNKRFNEMHQGLSCCGVTDFEDWIEKYWIPFDALEDAFIESGKIHSNGRLEDLVIPGSCCRPNSTKPCYHDFLLQGKKVTMESIVESTFTDGCAPTAENIFSQAINAFTNIAILIVIIQTQFIVLSEAYRTKP